MDGLNVTAVSDLPGTIMPVKENNILTTNFNCSSIFIFCVLMVKYIIKFIAFNCGSSFVMQINVC